jgi:hypothetical protein
MFGIKLVGLQGLGVKTNNLMVAFVCRLVLMGVAIDKLNTNLLGEGELDRLAIGGSQLGDTLLDGLGIIHNLGHSDAPLL